MNPASAQRVSFALGAASAWLVVASGAHAQSYAGTYAASAPEVTRKVTNWPKECGAEPAATSSVDRPLVQVTNVGAHLLLQFPDRRVRTDACFRASPGVTLTSSTAIAGRWAAECRSAEGAPNVEIARYRVQATGPYLLEVIEETDYSFLSGSTACQTSLRRVQKLERLAAERAPSAAATAQGVPAPCFPGPATKLRLRPTQARIEPGQRVCFSLVGLDDASCPSEVSAEGLKWELRKPEAARATLSEGCFRAAPNAAEAEGTFRVIASYGALRGESEVTVRARDLSDITAERGAAGSPRAPEPVASASSPRNVTSAGVRAAALKRDDLPVWLAGGAAALALVIAGLGLMLRKLPSSSHPTNARSRSEPRLSSVPAAAPSAPLNPASSVRSPGAAVAPATLTTPPEFSDGSPNASPTPARAKEAAPLFLPSEPMICPSCRRGFSPGGSTSCSVDGSTLIPYSNFVKLSSPQNAAPKPCQQCGAMSASDSVFCGECGTRLST